MKNIKVRNAILSDIPQLVCLRKMYLLEKCEAKEVENDSMLYLQIQRYFNAHIDKDIDIVVAEVDADIIGVFCVCYLYLLPGMNPDSERSAYLIFDYIKPEFRISEVREKIFEYSMMNAKEKNATVYEVEVIKSELSRYEKAGFIKSPFPLVSLYISDKSNYTQMKTSEVNISFRKADISDISDLLELRVKFLAEVLAEEEISIKRALYDRLKVYIEEFLNKRFDVFLAENRTEIVGAVFVLYYEKVPDMQINNGKVGAPVNFFIQPSYKKTDLAKCLLSFAVECTLEKEVRLFEMAVPKESVGFYMELGFVQMELVALQAYIKHDA
jgi:GNAT superfamily N-acetyltransferase